MQTQPADNNRVNEINITASISNLPLIEASIEIDKTVQEAFTILQTNGGYPGLILTENGSYIGLLPRNRFFELMSKSYMPEMFNKRDIAFFYEEYPTDEILVLPGYTLVVKAAETALLREEKLRNDPIVVEMQDGSFKLLDIHQLLLAQTQVHMLTMQSLKAANEFKDEVISIAAHDLKNPLNGILGFSTLINEDTRDPEIKEMSDLIFQSAKNMLGLIDDLLKSAVAEGTRNKLNLEMININDLIKSIMKSFDHAAQQKGQELILKCETDGDVRIVADKLKISEAIDNLISNAVKYSPNNKIIQIKLMSSGDSINIHIKDEGPGFTEKDMEKIFGKFQRLSAVPTGGESSTGLGLYIVKQIIDLHSGKISVCSKPGAGSTFKISLPAKIKL